MALPPIGRFIGQMQVQQIEYMPSFKVPTVLSANTYALDKEDELQCDRPLQLDEGGTTDCSA